MLQPATRQSSPESSIRGHDAQIGVDSEASPALFLSVDACFEIVTPRVQSEIILGPVMHLAEGIVCPLGLSLTQGAHQCVGVFPGVGFGCGRGRRVRPVLSPTVHRRAGYQASTHGLDIPHPGTISPPLPAYRIFVGLYMSRLTVNKSRISNGLEAPLRPIYSPEIACQNIARTS